MNWYIGQDVVAIKDAYKIKKGSVYTITSLRKSLCKCNIIDICVGFIEKADIEHCLGCNTKYTAPDNLLWHGESLFRPLDELADISELTEVLKEPVFN